jgi:DNA-binding response OmpR family regulator
LSCLTFISEALERLGLVPEVAFGGNDGLRRLACGGVVGVLLDLRLPDLHGLDVLRTLRRRGDPVPVVVLTGFGNVPDAVEAMRLGALDFLMKPVSAQSLAEAVDRLRVAGPSADILGSAPVPAVATRLAEMVVRFLESPSDARTVEEFCERVGPSISPRTFRVWCHALGIRAGELRDLARVLRATRLVLMHRCEYAVVFDADERTTRSLLLRGFGDPRGPAPTRDLAEVCRTQRYVTSSTLVEAVVQLRPTF